MKVNGIALTSMRIVKAYLPTNDGAVEFKFRPLRSDEDFDKVMPRPVAPEVTKPGGITFRNVEDKAFRKALDEWAEHKIDWEFLQSISVTDGLEWGTVDLSDPNTWKNWKNDLEAIFGTQAANILFGKFMDAQYITEEGMEKARASFLTSTLEQSGK